MSACPGEETEWLITSATRSPSPTNASKLKNVILRLISLKHDERKEPPSEKPPIKPPTRRKKPPIKEPPDPPNPGHRRRDDQAPIGDPAPKRDWNDRVGTSVKNGPLV